MIIIACAFGIVFGLLLGLSISLTIVVNMLKKSNDIGDSTGTFEDFGDYIRVMNSEDDLHRIY